MATANLENSAPTIHADQNLIAGRYRTLTQIGHGRLGEVFSAIDEGDGEPGVELQLAIQTIPESVVRNNRLFNQINLGYTKLRAIAHPNIVNFRHFGRDGKFGYLVMDLLDGGSLRLVLNDAQRLTLDEAKPVIRGVGDALRLLHANDMLHGNLTPSNVFITHELEVRLLDVLPLDSAEPIMQETATSGDDVFDLACLAYEMLAGKHPFNDNPAEARLAGLEADRIASLTDVEWSALCRALSLDRAQRTSSVADFMRDFGIRGTERLWPTVDQPISLESVASPTVPEAQPEARPATPAQSTPTAVPVATVELATLSEDWPPQAGPDRKRTRPLRAVFLGVLLAGLSAWNFYGQPDENIVDLISYVSERADVGRTERNAGTVELPTPDLAQPVATERDAMIEEIVVTMAQPTVQLTPAATTSTEPGLDFIESIVTVSERDGAARIAPLFTDNSTMPLIWWTSEHTANADTDFIAVEQQTMTDASTGDGTTLYIPLVNDDLPEAPESFFVNVGLRNTQLGQVERIGIVRVDIVDDDLP